MKIKLLLIGCLALASTGFSQTVTDADGNVYQTVAIGTQEWMAENLKTTKYNDGTDVVLETDNSAWQWAKDGWKPRYCYYNNDSGSYANTYGALYNYYAVYSGKLCPTGWHVPTDSEWTVLTDHLMANGHGAAEGLALKSTSGWNDNNGASGNGTDNFGFNAVPGGSRGTTGGYTNVGNSAFWWSATLSSTGTFSYYRGMFHNKGTVSGATTTNMGGLSVRCLNDAVVTGIDDQKVGSTGVSVYPNPTQGNLTVEINNPSLVNALSIKVLDAQSSEVFNQLATNTAQTIDVSSWAAGIYFIHILNGAKTVDVKKVVVNK